MLKWEIILALISKLAARLITTVVNWLITSQLNPGARKSTHTTFLIWSHHISVIFGENIKNNQEFSFFHLLIRLWAALILETEEDKVCCETEQTGLGSQNPNPNRDSYLPVLRPARWNRGEALSCFLVSAGCRRWCKGWSRAHIRERPSGSWPPPRGTGPAGPGSAGCCWCSAEGLGTASDRASAQSSAGCRCHWPRSRRGEGSLQGESSHEGSCFSFHFSDRSSLAPPARIVCVCIWRRILTRSTGAPRPTDISPVSALATVRSHMPQGCRSSP